MAWGGVGLHDGVTLVFCYKMVSGDDGYEC